MTNSAQLTKTTARAHQRHAQIVTVAHSTFAAMHGVNDQDKETRLASISELLRLAGEFGPLGDRARQFLSEKYGAEFFL
jgi:hypothetical protein